MLRCCYCNDLATGRYCFMGYQQTIVDNAFCGEHIDIVCNQTLKSLKSIHPASSTWREYMLKQRWSLDEQPPILPASKEELQRHGAVYVR